MKFNNKILASIMFFTAICIGQVRPTKQVGAMTTINRNEIKVIQNDCFTETYETTNSWDLTKRNYFPATACPGHNPLPAGQTQGSITINNGRVNFNEVRGAHENRIFKNLGTAFDTDFEVNFEFNLSAPFPGTTGTGIIPLALTSDWKYDPTFEAPTTAGKCGKYSPMDVIALNCYNQANTLGQSSLALQIIDDGVLVPTGSNNSIVLQQYNTTYYVTLKVFGNGVGSLSVYTDSERKTQLRNGEICFNVPQTVNGLTYLQHSTSSAAGLSRITSGWIDNTKICKTQKSCCQISLNGENVFCNASTSNATFTLTGSGNLANSRIEILPNDVEQSRNGNTLTITRWGQITSAPKKYTITSKTTSCECGEIKDVKTIYVYPKLETKFDVNSVGTSGNMLTDFNAVSNFIMPGATHQWEIYLSDNVANQGVRVRDPEWHNTNSSHTFKIYTLASNPLVSHTYEQSQTPYPNLLAGNYYLIKHVMFFDSGLCNDNSQSLRLIYISNNFRVSNIGDISEPDFKNKLSNFQKSLKN